MTFAWPLTESLVPSQSSDLIGADAAGEFEELRRRIDLERARGKDELQGLRPVGEVADRVARHELGASRVRRARRP